MAEVECIFEELNENQEVLDSNDDSKCEPHVPITTSISDQQEYQVTGLFLDDLKSVKGALNRHDWKKEFMKNTIHFEIYVNRRIDIQNQLWISRPRRNADAAIVRHKARLVIK